MLNIELCRESDVRWCWSDKPDGWYLSEYFLWKLCSHCGGELFPLFPLFPLWGGMHPHFMSEKNSNRGKSIPRMFSPLPNKEQLKTLQSSYFLSQRCFHMIGFVSTLGRCSLVDWEFLEAQISDRGTDYFVLIWMGAAIDATVPLSSTNLFPNWAKCAFTMCVESNPAYNT